MRFHKYHKFIIALFVTIAVTACQEVIKLDLNDASPRLVIEGFINDQPGPYTVKITKTAEFYDSNVFPPQSGAVVTITDENGNAEVLTETTSGNYETNAIQGVRGMTYTLSVAYEGKSYAASNTIPTNLITLDSVSYEFEEESIFNDEGYYARAHFSDPAGIDNYFRFNVFVNGEIYLFEYDDGDEIIEDDNFWLWSDKFSDGNLNDYDFPHTLVQNDSVYVELHHLSRSTYDYYRTVVDVIDGGGVAPSNPISNFSDTALGYFGAFSVTKNYVIVK